MIFTAGGVLFGLLVHGSLCTCTAEVTRDWSHEWTSPSTFGAGAIVRINTGELVFRTSSRYKCWNIDGSPNRGFQWRNLSHPNLLQLAQGLPAGYLRFGGSGNDALWYGDGIGSASSCAEGALRNFECLNSTTLDGLLALAEAASARLVFGLSITNVGCARDAQYHACLDRSRRQWGNATSWNSTNAEALMRYLAERGQPYAYELGNEENSHWPLRGLSPEEEAQSFAKLSHMITRLYPDVAKRPKVIGPDADYQDSNATQALSYKHWAIEFLGNVSEYMVPLHAATLHEYIEVGWNGSSWTSLDPTVLDKTATCADDFRNTVKTTSKRTGLHVPEVWAGEIGPHNGGSPPCNHSSLRWANFANSFWYMDAMATKAAHGFSVFCRQDFIGADYGLVDCSTQTPLPDYYLSKIWTELMGSGVLGTAVLDAPRTVRAYAHCAADDTRDVVALLLNLAEEAIEIDLVVGSKITKAARTEWHFTAGEDGLGGTGVRLGGNELVWVPGQALPPMEGVRKEPLEPVRLAQHSIVFVRLPGAAPAGLC